MEPWGSSTSMRYSDVLFCAGKKKQNFKYNDLHQHASGVGKCFSNKNAKQKVNHLALTNYLESDLASESEETKLYWWPWPGIIVNIVKDPKSLEDVENTKYWMDRFSEYKPEEVEISWDNQNKIAQTLVRFNNDWTGSELQWSLRI